MLHRLPDTEEKQPEFYKKDKGSAQIHGQNFEYKFCALVFLRATNKGYKFKLASNAKEYGKFDDVVVEFLDDNSRKKHIFLQLKSKPGHKIQMQQLLEEKGDFSLRKYYKSYKEIEEKFNCSEKGVKLESSIDESLFIIYTNADVGQKLKSYNVIDFSQEEFLMTGGTVLQFNEEEHKVIYEHLQEPNKEEHKAICQHLQEPTKEEHKAICQHLQEPNKEEHKDIYEQMQEPNKEEHKAICQHLQEPNKEEHKAICQHLQEPKKEEHKAIYQHLQEPPKHREFLSRFRICYGQAKEEEMDRHIKSELQQIMKVPESELDLNYKSFLPIMQDWWQHKNFFLKDTNYKENDPLLKTSEEIRTALIAKILDQRTSELDELSLKYKESILTDMKQLINLHKAVLIFAPGRSTTLTAAKIHQVLGAGKHAILNLKQLIRYKPEVMMAWKSRFDVLVLESQTSTEKFQEDFYQISMILKEGVVEKKLIFISDKEGNTEQLSALRSTCKTNLTEINDDWNFTDIVPESTTFLLEKKVIFQGTETQLKNLDKENNFCMLNALDYDSFSLLLANEKPSIGTPIEKNPVYYIDRPLQILTL